MPKTMRSSWLRCLWKQKQLRRRISRKSLSYQYRYAPERVQLVILVVREASLVEKDDGVKDVVASVDWLVKRGALSMKIIDAMLNGHQKSLLVAVVLLIWLFVFDDESGSLPLD